MSKETIKKCKNNDDICEQLLKIFLCGFANPNFNKIRNLKIFFEDITEQTTNKDEFEDVIKPFTKIAGDKQKFNEQIVYLSSAYKRGGNR